MELSNPQGIFLNQLNTKFRAYVGGFGSGKTFVGCLDLLIFAMENPCTVQGYFAPTYPQIRDIFYSTFEEAAQMLGFRVEIKYGDKEVSIYKGQAYYGTVICRSMEKPATIVGFKIARALVDEIDTLPKMKAKQAWIKIIARMRLVVKGELNSIGVTTTPEGFLFVYDTFKKDPKASYSMVQASSYENEAYLPPDYIPSLIETYDEALAMAYIRGQFVNLTTGSVYPHFNRAACNTVVLYKQGEPLHIGMDFNVGKMAACVFNDRSEGIDEFMDYADTPSIITAIKSRYPKSTIHVYPDASGQSGSTKGATVTDHKLLKAAGFGVYSKKVNPRVRDRIITVNKRFEDGTIKINAAKMPVTTEALEQQAYDKHGEPDKSTGHDHPNDAAGYFILYNHPLSFIRQREKRYFK